MNVTYNVNEHNPSHSGKKCTMDSHSANNQIRFSTSSATHRSSMETTREIVVDQYKKVTSC